jgi:hypothetical protein
MQLVNQEEQNVELADCSKAHRDSAQTTVELAGAARLQLQHWQQFAQSARRDARTVQRTHVPLLHSGEHARERVDSLFKEFRTCGREAHDVNGQAGSL